MTEADRPVVTVTPNPALDITYEVDTLTLGQSHRVTRVLDRAGGKGINVARVVRALGGTATVVAPFGGDTGQSMTRTLRHDGFEVCPVPVAAETRRTVTVVSGGEATVLNEPGRALGPDEWEAVLNAAARATDAAVAVAVSGSMPSGAPDDLHTRLIEQTRAAGVPVVVDTSGRALLSAAEAGPDLLKPNVDELRETTGTDDVEAGARALLSRGALRVVVSLGADGIAAFSGDEAWRVRPVPGIIGNPTGAGDAVVAALCQGIAAGVEWPGVLTRAAALGAAAVLADAAGEVDLAAYERFLTARVVERFN